MAFFAQNWRPPLNRSAGAPVEKVPYFRLGSGRGGPRATDCTQTRSSGRVGKLNGKKLKICPQNGVFRPKLMASFNRSAGAPLKRYPILDLGLVEGPAGYRLHPNPEARGASES